MVAKRGMTTRAATKGGPDLRGLAAETGTLDVGMLAALIAVDGDSLIERDAGRNHLKQVELRSDLKG